MKKRHEYATAYAASSGRRAGLLPSRLTNLTDVALILAFVGLLVLHLVRYQPSTWQRPQAQRS
jgi:hypothetical protein